MVLKCLEVKRAKPSGRKIWIVTFSLDEKLKENKTMLAARMEAVYTYDPPYEPEDYYSFKSTPFITDDIVEEKLKSKKPSTKH